MSYHLLTIRSASEWQNVMQKAKELLDLGARVVVRQSQDLVFTQPEFSAFELSTNPSQPARNFVYDGQGYKIWMQSANLLDIWNPGTSENGYSWKRMPSPSNYSVYVFPDFDSTYGYVTRMQANTSSHALVFVEKAAQLLQGQQYGFSIFVRFASSSGSGFYFTIRFSELNPDNNYTDLLIVNSSGTYVSTSWQRLQRTFTPSSELKDVSVQITPLATTNEYFFAKPWLGFANVMPADHRFGANGMSLFGHLKNSEIRDLHIKWLNFGYVRNRGLYSGILARTLEESIVHNVILENCVTGYGSLSGLIAGAASDASVEFVRAIDCTVMYKSGALMETNASVEKACVGGLFGIAGAHISVYDSVLNVKFRTVENNGAAPAGFAGGLFGSIVKSPKGINIYRVKVNASEISETLTHEGITPLIV